MMIMRSSRAVFSHKICQRQNVFQLKQFPSNTRICLQRFCAAQSDRNWPTFQRWSLAPLYSLEGWREGMGEACTVFKTRFGWWRSYRSWLTDRSVYIRWHSPKKYSDNRTVLSSCIAYVTSQNGEVSMFATWSDGIRTHIRQVPVTRACSKPHRATELHSTWWPVEMTSHSDLYITLSGNFTAPFYWSPKNNIKMEMNMTCSYELSTSGSW
jgi:hypothetical protein